jgi:exosortase C (VPDSG-CTERM-specific)
MNDPDQNSVHVTPLDRPIRATPLLKRSPKFTLAAATLVVAFAVPLYNLVRFALQSELYSYVLLVPFVSLYLFSIAAKNSIVRSTSTSATAALLFAIGVVILTGYWISTALGVKLVQQDSVSATTSSFVFLLAGACAAFLQPSELRRATFPLFFLLFMVPFPVAMEHAIESFLQRGSAPPAFWLLKLAGTPVFRQDMVFQLPGITLQIAPECSGIRSSIVLFMTSLIAGHLFLRATWSRALLALIVLPLALVRNGFRVFTIGQLCVSVGPHMIDSAIHHKGGAIFFALSLIPFFLLLFLLIKLERRVKTPLLKSQPL